MQFYNLNVSLESPKFAIQGRALDIHYRIYF